MIDNTVVHDEKLQPPFMHTALVVMITLSLSKLLLEDASGRIFVPRRGIV